MWYLICMAGAGLGSTVSFQLRRGQSRSGNSQRAIWAPSLPREINSGAMLRVTRSWPWLGAQPRWHIPNQRGVRMCREPFWLRGAEFAPSLSPLTRMIATAEGNQGAARGGEAWPQPWDTSATRFEPAKRAPAREIPEE